MPTRTAAGIDQLASLAPMRGNDPLRAGGIDMPCLGPDLVDISCAACRLHRDVLSRQELDRRLPEHEPGLHTKAHDMAVGSSLRGAEWPAIPCA